MKNITLILVMLLSFFTFNACSDDGDDEIVQLTIASEKGVGYTLGGEVPVLYVKEGNSQEWSAFYSDIEGFEFKAGYEIVLEARKVKIKNPPQDSSNTKYILIKIISSLEK